MSFLVKYFKKVNTYSYSNQANMASAASARYSMRPALGPALRVPVSAPVSDRSKSLQDYHACARSAGCGKGRKKKTGPARRTPTRRAKERSNIVPLNLQRMKQKARARRPQQAPRRSASTGQFIGPRPRPAQAPVISRAALASMFGG